MGIWAFVVRGNNGNSLYLLLDKKAPKQQLQIIFIDPKAYQFLLCIQRHASRPGHGLYWHPEATHSLRIGISGYRTQCLFCFFLFLFVRLWMYRFGLFHHVQFVHGVGSFVVRTVSGGAPDLIRCSSASTLCRNSVSTPSCIQPLDAFPITACVSHAALDVV